MPPYLAGRNTEIHEFRRLLAQTTILENLVLTGLRGVGKTVLLDTLKPIAMQDGWLWVGTDLSEASSISEEKICVRLLTDLSVVSTGIAMEVFDVRRMGFADRPELVPQHLSFQALLDLYNRTPGLPQDKLKAVLELVWKSMAPQTRRGLIFAYDEAQNLADHAEREQFPLSLLLDTFQSIQKKGIPFMLVLTGLPTLFPKLVAARTFAERMFHIVTLKRLTDIASREAILKPIEDANCPIKLNNQSVETIVDMSGGYPYFIQFICREVYDVFVQKLAAGDEPRVPTDEIVRKLDVDFFSGRWARATDRQRELLGVIATLDNCDSEFTVQEVVEACKAALDRPFSSSHVNQMLASLSTAGLVYKNRYGKYSFAVPLLGQFILRQRYTLN